MFLSNKKERSKSLKRLVKNKISTPVAVQPTKIELPKKIIKALYDYRAQGPHELSFQKGDFFHVTGRENDAEWYEASNPATNSRGLVPVSCFQVIERTANKRPVSSSTSGSDSSDNMHRKLYGVVLYDFKAERPDELDAQAGESIVIIAQSNHEWFLAKPIGRLGGPGLIPVSFVEVRDAQTGESVEAVQLPPVKDWKKMTQMYEASTIPLGVIEQKKKDVVVFAAINSFILEGDQYWFVLYAKTIRGMHRILYRLYDGNHFYDFQLSLLQTYPAEAGQEDSDRILPYMPGPLKEIDDKVTTERQIDLNRYCQELLNLPHYLSESDLVQKQLFGIHEGDIELDYDPRGVSNRQSTEDHIKVKIIHKDDIFAIKMPVDCTLEYLKSKVYERIGLEVNLYYKSEVSGLNQPLEGELDMEEAFVQAIQRGKLTITTGDV